MGVVVNFLPATLVCMCNISTYSIREAAQKLGLDTSQIRHLLAKGQIKEVKLARDWVVLDLSRERKRKPKTKRELGWVCYDHVKLVST